MLIALAGYLFLALSVSAALLAIEGGGATMQAWLLCAAIAVPWLGMAGWPLLVTRWRGLGPVSDLRLRGTPRDIGVGVLTGVGAVAVAIPVAALTQWLLGHDITSSAGDLFDEVSDANAAPLVLFALLAGIGAPVVEEICFRGLLYGALDKRGMAPGVSVLVVGATFALFHFEPTRIPILLVIGLALTWARARTGTTAASIAAHMTVNLLPMLALLADALS